MAYFLKKTKNKKGLYLQIYESFYDPARKHTAHRSIKAIGYEHELKQAGIEDPIAYYKAQVDAMNAERKGARAAERGRQITEQTPERLAGHFAFEAVERALNAQADIRMLQLAGDFRFDLYGLLSDLVMARLCAPCSKRRTFHDVLPRLAGAGGDYSLDQLYDGLAFLGSEYEKVVEIYTERSSARFGSDASTTYFDCTNFYFEIDREDGLRRKGPSKENRHDPIVGLGLLLDADCVPIGMRIFPGNASEKPVMREVIGSLKSRGNIAGRTVRVADKGLNCADNVADALLAGDGYIFSKSVKQLPAKELAWALSDEGWVDVKASDGSLLYRLKSVTDSFDYEFRRADGAGRQKASLPEKRVVSFNPKLARKHLAEIDRQVEKARALRLSGAKRSEYGDSAKYVKFTAVDKNGEETGDAVAAVLNHDAIQRARRLAGYNMIVTSETSMPDAEVYGTYHNLWRIEESFKAMKSQLDARPVYVQKEETIKGHFLICYIAVLLERLLQLKVLGGRFCTEAIMELARNYRVVEVSKGRYVNISKSSEVLTELERMSGLPLNNYHLTQGQLDRIMSWQL
ncbi:MAG: IS1634 family transposase [Candidatus Ventricola sp.]